MINEQDQVPKYKKKSNKVVQKSKHKHEYKDCLFLDEYINSYYKGEYCVVCGKIGNFKMFESEPYRDNLRRILSNEELLEKYSDLEIKVVGRLSRDKYIGI